VLSKNRRDADVNEYEGFKKQIMDDAYANEVRFDGPPIGIKSKEFVDAHFGSKSQTKEMMFAKGTTTLAFIYEPATSADKGGIIVAVDSRASGGAYIMSRTIMKILPIGDHMVGTMAGGAADCQFWMRFLTKYCSLFELREKTKISVSSASKYLANILYSYRGSGLQIGSMIAGFDKAGPSIFGSIVMDCDKKCQECLHLGRDH